MSSSKSKPARALIAERAADSTAPVHICVHVTHLTGSPAHRWNLIFSRIAETRVAQVGINASGSSPSTNWKIAALQILVSRLNSGSHPSTRKFCGKVTQGHKPGAAATMCRNPGGHTSYTGLLSKQLGYWNISFVVLEMHAASHASLWLKSNRDNVSFLCNATKSLFGPQQQ